MTQGFRLVVCLLLTGLVPLTVSAQERPLTVQNSQIITQDSQVTRDARREPAFMDLLEFLGEFAAEDGAWLDFGQILEQIESGQDAASADDEDDE